jgi:hypothetical protein
MYIQSNFKDELNYYELNTTKQLIVNLYHDNGDVVDCTEACLVELFDSNITYNSETREFTFQGEGTAKVKVLLLDNATNTYFHEQIDVLIYDSFFRTNYLDSFFSEYDSKLIRANEKLKIIMDALMQYLDILYAYKKDIQNLTDARNVKSKYLSLLGQTFGFEKIDFTNENSANEASVEFLYREILVNLFDILNIRGTKLSYELFFNALGFDIKLEEFWFNSDGNLVQIDVVEDDTGDVNSTYLTYDTSGAPVLIGPEINKDPRKYNTANNAYNIANKSNYVRPIITNKIDNVGQLANFNIERKKIIKKYLEFLRPQHIQYLTTVITANLSYIYDNDGNLIQDSEVLLLFNTITENYSAAKQYCLDNTEGYADTLTIDSVEEIDTNTINLVFNKKIKAPNAFVTPTINTLSHFTALTNTLSSVRRIPNEKNKLQIHFTGAVAGAEQITTTNISDVYGNLFSDLVNFNLPATLIGPFAIPNLTNIYAVSRRHIQILFDVELDYASVIDLNNYSVLDDAFVIEYAFLGSDLKTINLFLKYDMVHDFIYTLTISNIYNYDLSDWLTISTKNITGIGYDTVTVTNQKITLPDCGVINEDQIDWQITPLTNGQSPNEKYIKAINVKLQDIFGYWLHWDTAGFHWDITNIKWDQKDLTYDSLEITQI